MPDIVINSLYHLNDCMGIANPLDSVSLYILLHPFQQCCQQYSLDEHQHHPVASSPHRNPYNKAASKCQCPSHSSASKMTVNSQSGPRPLSSPVPQMISLPQQHRHLDVCTLRLVEELEVHLLQ